MREFKISQINPSSSFPMSVVVEGDLTSFALGSYYRDSVTGAILPPYTTPAPSGNYVLISTTSFEIVGNPIYSGKYTVYSPVSNTDRPPSIYNAGKTTINTNETVPDTTPSDPPNAKTAGYVRNFSTYVISISPDRNLIIPPMTQNTDSTSLDFLGRGIVGWGEPFAQNFMDLMQTFAGNTPPASPVPGQQFFSLSEQRHKIFNGQTWEIPNLKVFGVTYRHTQSTASDTWTVNHGLELSAPYIGFWSAFVNRDGKVRPITPSSVEFINADRCVVKFTKPETGYFLIRQ